MSILAPRRLGLGAPTLVVLSPAFKPGSFLPKIYAGRNGQSPPLSWPSVPGAKSAVIFVEDPDAPTPQPYVHWFYPVGPGVQSVAVGLPKYHGPTPPAGETHHYHFQVFASDLPASAIHSIDDLKGHVLAWGELVGLYKTPSTSIKGLEQKSNSKIWIGVGIGIALIGGLSLLRKDKRK